MLPFSLIVWGQGHICFDQASILNAITPIFTVIMEHLLTREEKMTQGSITRILVGFAGVAVIVGAEDRAGSGISLAAQCALLSATNASLVAMLIPPGAIITGILFLDETVLPRHLVGLALIIAGLLVTDGRIRLPRRG